MKLSKKILKAINEGVINALSFDDEDFEEDDMQLLKVSGKVISDERTKLIKKIYYTEKLQEMICSPMGITKKFIQHAIEWHELYGVLYNPHLDGIEFKKFVHKCLEVEEYNWQLNLNWIDTSEVTDMLLLFYNSSFNGNISEWDVSNVVNMFRVFLASLFTGDISNWNVSNVKDMSYMFQASKFNGDISNWNVSNVKDMDSMFSKSIFNGDISNWDISNVNDMRKMFSESLFNCDISKWVIPDDTFIESMFWKCEIKKEYKPFPFNI